VSKKEISALRQSIIRRYVEGKINGKKLMAELARLEKLEKQKEGGAWRGEMPEVQ